MRIIQGPTIPLHICPAKESKHGRQHRDGLFVSHEQCTFPNAVSRGAGV